MSRRIPIEPGQRYERLVVIREAGRHATSGAITYLCQCDCGTETVVAGIGLKHGTTQSCGCLRTERARKALRERGHGHTIGGPSPTWISWSSMRQRCYLKTMKCYPRYGGKGITVCDRWRDSFENFLADMGQRPEGMTLDRIDPDGNYEPDNCRWATNEVQRENRRPVGQSQINRAEFQRQWKTGMPIDEIAEHFSLTANQVRTQAHYLRERGWDVPRRLGGTSQRLWRTNSSPPSA